MPHNKRDHPEAREELRAAFNSAEDFWPGSGTAILNEADAAVTSILDAPEQWAVVSDWDGEPVLRSKHFKTKPYRVIYFVRGDEVVVIAYAHERRQPGYWKHRVVEVA